MTAYVFDLEWKVAEGDRPVEDCQHIWCGHFKELNNPENHNVFTMQSFHILEKWFRNHDELTLIGHNILGADLEILKNQLGIDYTVGRDTIAGMPCKFIDTLVMSRTHNPDIVPNAGGKHSLASWALRLDGTKPVVHDWEDQPIEVYLHRCECDVILTEKLYNHLKEEMNL